jgi:F-type H+-transporting ATPase subunit b
MASVQKDADKEKNKILDEASREARYLVDKSKVEIEQEIVKAHKELKKKLSKLVVSCTERVIEREVDEEDHKKLIDEFIQGTEKQ